MNDDYMQSVSKAKCDGKSKESVIDALKFPNRNLHFPPFCI